MADPTAEAERPAFYCKDGLIWKAPIRTILEKDGKTFTEITLGFPVAKVHEAVADQGDAIAAMLCQAEAFDAVVAALRLAMPVVEYDAEARGDETLQHQCAAALAKVPT